MAAPVWAAADEDATDDEPVALPLLECAEVLVDIFEALLEAVVEPLLVVAALAATEPLLEPEEAALEEATAVA